MMSVSWAPMMALMMLPGAAPAIARSARAALFAGSYLVVWTAVGLAIYALYTPPAPAVAAALIGAAVLYELAPWTRALRRRCRQERCSGARYGGLCIGSSLGLMAVLVALDPMSFPLMCAAGAIALIQKELLV